MFNEAKYWEVNREERFYCFLLAHAILSSESFRKKIVKKLEAFNGLNPDNIEVYIEAAAIRDYWKNLGELSDPKTEERRKTVIEKIFTLFNITVPLSQYKFFRSPGGHLWFPGRWEPSKSEKEERKELEEIWKRDLEKIRWACNAKPDILLVSEKTVVMIEAKYESVEGKSEETGYEQLQIQRYYIGKIMQTLIPAFSNKELKHVYLTKNDSAKEYINVHWSEIKEILLVEDIDKFTFDCFQRF